MRFDESGHRVNLLFDHETGHVRVKSPYTHGRLSVRVKKPAPLFVRIPSWVSREEVRVEGVAGKPGWSNGYLLIAEPPVNRDIAIDFPLKEEEIEMKHRTRNIRVRLRGDEVAAMDSFGADVTFFDEFE